MPKRLIFLVFGLSIFQTIASLAVPLLTMKMINDLSGAGFVWTTGLSVVLVLLLQAVLGGVTYYLMRKLGERVVANLRKHLWQHVLYLKVPYYDAHESGEMMSRITQDTSVVKELATEQLVSFVTGVFSIIGAVTILLWIDWKMTLLMLIAVPIAILATLPLAQKMNKIAKANQDELASFSGHLGRVLSNIRLVKSSQTEQAEFKRGTSRIEQLYTFGLKEARILAILSPIMTLIMMIVFILLFGYGGTQVASGAISSGELVAVMIYLVQIIIPFTQMATFFTALQKALGATERIQGILQQPIETQTGRNTPSMPQPITFEDVHFGYQNHQILNGMQFTIPAGKTTAFVSSSGGGKTTMFSLIERFYDVTSGVIRYGDTNIEEFNLQQWRQLFGYVTQDAPLMNGTIRDNVLYGQKDASDQQIWVALKSAYAYDFVAALEYGLETEVGEGGIKLSGGQKQRIAIARAIIRNPQILLLDEATSNLDNESEREVQLALETLMKNRTTIIIAHRLSTITNADQLLLFDEGKLTGVGTHSELATGHAYYKQLLSVMNS